MPPVVIVKTFAPQAAHFVRVICHYLNKYNTQVIKTIDAVVSDPTDKAALLAFIAGINAACAIWNKYWPAELA